MTEELLKPKQINKKPTKEELDDLGTSQPARMIKHDKTMKTFPEKSNVFLYKLKPLKDEWSKSIHKR